MVQLIGILFIQKQVSHWGVNKKFKHNISVTILLTLSNYYLKVVEHWRENKKSILK